MTQLPPSPPQMPPVPPPIPPQASLPPYGAVPSEQTKGLAVRGLVLSIFRVLAVLLAVSMIMLVVSILMPGQTKAREAAKTAACNMNLSNIGKAVATYQSENHDQFPPNLEVFLKEDGGLSPRTLRCPSDGLPDAPLDGTSYFYCAPEGDDIDPATIIACDVAPVHALSTGGRKELRNYLRANLSVQRCTESEFQQLLQQPENRRFAEELAKGVNMTPRERIKYIAPRDEE